MTKWFNPVHLLSFVFQPPSRSHICTFYPAKLGSHLSLKILGMSYALVIMHIPTKQAHVPRFFCSISVPFQDAAESLRRQSPLLVLVPCFGAQFGQGICTVFRSEPFWVGEDWGWCPLLVLNFAKSIFGLFCTFLVSFQAAPEKSERDALGSWRLRWRPIFQSC